MNYHNRQYTEAALEAIDNGESIQGMKSLGAMAKNPLTIEAVNKASRNGGGK